MNFCLGLGLFIWRARGAVAVSLWPAAIAGIVMEVPSDLEGLSTEELNLMAASVRRQIAALEQRMIRDDNIARRKRKKVSTDSRQHPFFRMWSAEKRRAKKENAVVVGNKANAECTKGQNKDAANLSVQSSNPMKRTWHPPPYCVPIPANVNSFDFEKLALAQKRVNGRLFDAIVANPPGELDGALVRVIPFHTLQDSGFIFVSTVTGKRSVALHWFKEWGYELIDEFALVRNSDFHNHSQGKYNYLVGWKGTDKKCPITQSKLQEHQNIYELIEDLVPDGTYLEVFAQRENLRDYWVSIGVKFNIFTASISIPFLLL